MMIKKKHLFHMVDPSPWPITVSMGTMLLMLSLAIWFSVGSYLMLSMSLMLIMMMSYQWWRDIVRESTFQGLHPTSVSKMLSTGMLLFIISEVLFFLSFFWAFFHSSLSPAMEVGLTWPPTHITPFNPMQIPLLNTIILLSSGVSITSAHHYLLNSQLSLAIKLLLITISLGVVFTLLQSLEYKESTFTMADSIYGSCFFVATGFHGLHVLIGSLFMMVTLSRLNLSHLTKNHHLGFELAAWYWHFVDVVWLMLYMSVYWWGM